MDGRLEKNNELVEQSGILELEKQLFLFLVDNRGKIKTLQPARKLLQESNTLTRAIRDARTLYSEDLAVLKQRSQTLYQEAETEKRRITQIRDKINILREGIRKDVEDRFFTLFAATLVSAIEREMEKYEPQNNIKFLTAESTTE